MTLHRKRAHRDTVWLSRCAPELAAKHRRELDELLRLHAAEVEAARASARVLQGARARKARQSARAVVAANPLMAAWAGRLPS